jgi:hypothetical protein
MMTWTIYDDYTAVIGALACGTYSFTTTVMFSGTSLLTDILEPEKQFVILRLPLFKDYFIYIVICLDS